MYFQQKRPGQHKDSSFALQRHRRKIKLAEIVVPPGRRFSENFEIASVALSSLLGQTAEDWKQHSRRV